ncbi:MAG: NAD(P)/FAD-dependent oxidoreductase [Pseudomonadota bacterium]|jgi:thioredoxin reductase (NADPH)|nr:NAD(P)/FAD-dependent oxidoreductase [Alphaproteobacteria bacterium]
MQYETDVVIVGAGPVGLFAIFECGMAKLKAHVVDAFEKVGGQCSALYPEKPIYDIAAYPSITAADLIDQLEKQAAPFFPTYHLNQQVTQLTPLNNDGTEWLVQTSTGTEIKTKSIIIAAGVGAFGPNRPPLDHLDMYEKNSIHYAVRNKDTYKDKHIVIAGGGDSAVDWALILKDIAASVKVVHRRAKFRAAPDSEEKLNIAASKGELELVTPYQLSGLQGTNGILSHVDVESLDGQKRSLQADYLLPFFGLSMNLGPIAEWGLNLEKHHIAVDQATSSTNRKGIYAIGDIATYPHKLKLILTGFAEAAQAAHAIRTHLYPDEITHFEYSTTKGVGF